MTPAPTTPRLLVAVAAGGAVGALARFGLDTLAPAADGFPWTTFAINVIGSFALALLPAVTVVRRSPQLAAALGPGVLGGFTTLSAYSEQARALIGDGESLLAGAYLVATLGVCLVAVALASSWSRSPEQDA